MSEYPFLGWRRDPPGRDGYHGANLHARSVHGNGPPPPGNSFPGGGAVAYPVQRAPPPEPPKLLPVTIPPARPLLDSPS
jgi:hypothetical protein